MGLVSEQPGSPIAQEPANRARASGWGADQPARCANTSAAAVASAGAARLPPLPRTLVAKCRRGAWRDRISRSSGSRPPHSWPAMAAGMAGGWRNVKACSAWRPALHCPLNNGCRPIGVGVRLQPAMAGHPRLRATTDCMPTPAERPHERISRNRLGHCEGICSKSQRSLQKPRSSPVNRISKFINIDSSVAAVDFEAGCAHRHHSLVISCASGG
jgi:hypothetical protein